MSQSPPDIINAIALASAPITGQEHGHFYGTRWDAREANMGQCPIDTARENEYTILEHQR